MSRSESLESIISWMWTKHVWYGPIFDKWWLEEGAEIFKAYASKHRQEFQKEPDMKLLKEIYEICARGGK